MTTNIALYLQQGAGYITLGRQGVEGRAITLARCGHFCTDAFAGQLCCLCEVGAYQPIVILCELCHPIPR